MSRQGKEYLSEVINAIQCTPDAFRIRLEDDRFLFSIMTTDTKTQDWFSVSAIYDSICEIDKPGIYWVVAKNDIPEADTYLQLCSSKSRKIEVPEPVALEFIGYSKDNAAIEYIEIPKNDISYLIKGNFVEPDLKDVDYYVDEISKKYNINKIDDLKQYSTILFEKALSNLENR